MSAETMATLLSVAWLLIQLSLDEGYGLAMLEAAAAGLPVLHTGNGAMTEVYPDSETDETWAALAKDVMDLLDESADDALRLCGFRAAKNAPTEAFCSCRHGCIVEVRA